MPKQNVAPLLKPVTLLLILPIWLSREGDDTFPVFDVFLCMIESRKVDDEVNDELLEEEEEEEAK